MMPWRASCSLRLSPMQAITVETERRSVRLDTPRVYRVGRSPDADLVVEGDTVSREHLEIRPSGEGWLLVDVGSRHGTWLDGRRIAELPLDRAVQLYLGASDGGTALSIRPDAAASTDRLQAPYLAPGPQGPVGAASPRPPGGPATPPPPRPGPPGGLTPPPAPAPRNEPA